MNCLIDKCDYSSTLDAKTKSDETLRVSIPFKDQVSANIVKRQMRDLSSKIGIDVQPIYTSKKLEQDLKLKEIKPRIVNQHSVVYCFQCGLCDSNYTSDIRRAICFNALLIIDILPLVATWEMPISPVILWKKIGQPATNCNRRFFNGFRLCNVSVITYQKSQEIPLREVTQKCNLLWSSETRFISAWERGWAKFFYKARAKIFNLVKCNEISSLHV